MSCTHECPICMDDIQAVNCTTTECGHQFHTSCLMKNIAHNGFGCPYCRSVLAEVPEEEDDDDDVSDDLTYEEDEELYDDYALRGMRWMFQQNQNEPLEDEVDEVPQEEDPVEPVLPRPSASVIAAKLLQQGITMEDLVKSLLSINHEEYEDCEDYELKESQMFGMFRIIISNYNLEQERAIQLTNTTNNSTNENPQTHYLTQEELQPDLSAQPKERNMPNRRSTMYFMREPTTN